jgi:hypothetical protein
MQLVPLPRGDDSLSSSASASVVLTSVKRRVHFATKKPPPRAGPALLLRSLASCCQGDWVTARGCAASSVALMENGWGNARLCDLGRCLGATADAHLGHWETSLASVTALSHDRRRHAEIGPWCLALRMAANTAMRHPEVAVELWREALDHPPFEGLGLHLEEFSSDEGCTRLTSVERRALMEAAASGKDAGKAAAEAGAGADRAVAARDMPVLVACHAFAAQALWCSGAHVEAVGLYCTS